VNYRQKVVALCVIMSDSIKCIFTKKTHITEVRIYKNECRKYKNTSGWS
jgi:hypothetical protein